MRQNPIEDRLFAALKYDVINGDMMEKSILESQIKEAIQVIKDQKTSIKAALAALSQNKTYPADIEYAKKCLTI